jgi:hypothetical protein
LDRDYLRGMISEIKKEIENIEELRNEMREIRSETSIIFRRSMGSILHDFYNGCERIFKKVAADINGGYEDSEKWHKGLLFKMTIPVSDIRSPVISEELAADLDEYLSFRHVFRNIYGFELKGERIGYLVGRFDAVAGRFIDEINTFLSFLSAEI